MNHNDIANMTITGLEKKWGTRPIVMLACAGYADEHWQIYHPDDIGSEIEEPMPRVTIDLEGHVCFHPDGHEEEELTEPAKYGL